MLNIMKLKKMFSKNDPKITKNDDNNKIHTKKKQHN